MIKFENVHVVGLEPAIRGMRNPMNSWDRSDSYKTCVTSSETLEIMESEFFVGDNDHELMMLLRNSGTDHRKFMRMINVYVDIAAPLYWWKEFDTYKVGTVANSCSTMHTIHEKEFTIEDFSCEHLINLAPIALDRNEYSLVFDGRDEYPVVLDAMDVLNSIIAVLNFYRDIYNKTHDKTYWRSMIQLLPSSYNQKRTVMMSYEVLANIYKSRKDHKLDEWRERFCKEFIEDLPYSELITGKGK